jgi:hypothetical protein
LRHGIALERYLERQKASRALAISRTDWGKALEPLVISTARIVVRLFGRRLKEGQHRRCTPDVDGEAPRFLPGVSRR